MTHRESQSENNLIEVRLLLSRCKAIREHAVISACLLQCSLKRRRELLEFRARLNASMREIAQTDGDGYGQSDRRPLRLVRRLSPLGSLAPELPPSKSRLQQKYVKQTVP
jgi:hypothetical protein